MKRDALGKFEKQLKVSSSHEIELGDYEKAPVRVYMDPRGEIRVQLGAIEMTTATLLQLTLDAISGAAVLRKCAA